MLLFWGKNGYFKKTILHDLNNTVVGNTKSSNIQLGQSSNILSVAQLITEVLPLVKNVCLL